MTITTLHLSHALGITLIAGTALLAGCEPAPVTRTTTTTEEITTRPLLPPASTTTIETQEIHRR